MATVSFQFRKISSMRFASNPKSFLRKAFGPGAPSGYVENLLQLPLAASVVLAEKSMRVREVMGFKVGEVIEFPQRADGRLELRVVRPRVLRGDRRFIIFSTKVPQTGAFGISSGTQVKEQCR